LRHLSTCQEVKSPISLIRPKLMPGISNC